MSATTVIGPAIGRVMKIVGSPRDNSSDCRSVGPIPKEGTYATGGAGNVVALKNPSHPSAAKVFVNWLLSKEGQEIFGKAMGHATRRLDVDTAWLYKIGYVPAKDGITVQEYYKYENQSRERIDRVRLPARKFARKLLK